MADISTIVTPDGAIYNLKDAFAREQIVGGIHYRGVTTTPLEDGSDANPVVIHGEEYTAVNGDLVIYNNAEFIFTEADREWHQFGDLSNLGELAYKDSVTTEVTPEGTVSQPTFTGDQMTSSGRYTPTGAVSVPIFTGTEGNVRVSGTPAGSIGVGTGNANYTPAGTVAAPEITVTPSTVSKYVADSSTGGGVVVAGTQASATMPVLATSIKNDTLVISWTAGSFTANTPTSVTLPTFSSQTIATGIDNASASAPAFTGEGVNLRFTGSAMTSSGKYTPAGSVSRPSFTGNEDILNVTGTPTGTVSQPEFTGTAVEYTGS